jgi:hypothetical protein
MALGKPVVCYIRDDLVGKYPDLPIVNANQDNLYEKLVALIRNKKARDEAGKKGKEYVHRRHLPAVVAKKSIELYQGMLVK